MGARLVAVLGMIGQHHGFNANAMNGKKIAPNGAPHRTSVGHRLTLQPVPAHSMVAQAF